MSDGHDLPRAAGEADGALWGDFVGFFGTDHADAFNAAFGLEGDDHTCLERVFEATGDDGLLIDVQADAMAEEFNPPPRSP